MQWRSRPNGRPLQILFASRLKDHTNGIILSVDCAERNLLGLCHHDRSIIGFTGTIFIANYLSCQYFCFATRLLNSIVFQRFSRYCDFLYRLR